MSAPPERSSFRAQAPSGPEGVPEYRLSANQLPSQENKDCFYAASVGDLAGVKNALSSGASPNWFNNPAEGAAALHKAAEGGHAAVIECLLDHGSVVDERLLTSQSAPLHLACANGHLKAAEVLIAHGAKINSGNSYGNTAMCGAIMGGHLPVVKLLLEKGANAKWTNNKASTPLHHVAYSHLDTAGKVEAAEALAKQGADVKAADAGGLTPLHLAAQDGNARLVELFLGFGSDPSTMDGDGRTALDHAHLRGNSDVEKLLRPAPTQVPEGSEATAQVPQGNEAPTEAPQASEAPTEAPEGSEAT